MHSRNDKDFSITKSNIIIYSSDDNHEDYIGLEKKMFCLRDNDLMKTNIITYNFDKFLKKEGWFWTYI